MTERPFHRSQAEMLPARPPPIASVGLLGWLRANLFSGPWNAALTLAALALLWLIVPPLIDWAFIDADFTGASGTDCTTDGACWAWLDQRIEQFLYGFYPGSTIRNIPHTNTGRRPSELLFGRHVHAHGETKPD